MTFPARHQERMAVPMSVRRDSSASMISALPPTLTTAAYVSSIPTSRLLAEGASVAGSSPMEARPTSNPSSPSCLACSTNSGEAVIGDKENALL